MTEHNPLIERQAELNFQDARKKARRERFFAWLFGKQKSLIPFDVIREEIQVFDPTTPTKQTIEIDKIIGSVGRYEEFTSHYLPLKDSFRDRWVSVQTHAMERGWPPIDVYQVGDSYFVIDGNHRVAIARQIGKDTIEANVSMLPDSENIDASKPTDAMLVAIGRANFMSVTNLDTLRPDHGVEVTAPGRYRVLTEQVLRFRQVLADIDGVEPTYEAAGEAWYDMVYLPKALIIEESGFVAHFEGRTTADFFVWLFQHRRSLRQQYGEYENWASLLARISADYDTVEHAHEQTGLIGRARSAVSDLLHPSEQEPSIFDDL